ncbi:MAG: SMC-Scp complex subunit ScpB [Armatimonadetes bacterium]|jgi:segregation and condensation protein B|nr:SMC-Scp complex subunit ScpB [Armatimonadota bacterium]
MDDTQLSEALECLLFVSGEAVPVERLAEALEVDAERVLQALEAMRARSDGGLQVAAVAGGWMLCTRPQYAQYVTRLLRVQPQKLSRAALETLAIIAYRQPITGPEIEAVRGVSVDGVMGTLQARGLIREAGRKQAPGRPILYETTEEFLRYLGIKDLAELPQLEA